MASERFEIVQNGEKRGYIFLDVPTPTFEHVSPFPASDAFSEALYVPIVTGSCMTAGYITWYAAGWPPWVGMSLGTLVGWGLSAVKVWRSGGLDAPGPEGGEVTIKVESWQDDGVVILDEIRDKSLTVEDFREVARAILVDKLSFARRPITGRTKLSQNKYNRIADEFKRLNYIHLTPNNKYVMSPRCMAFLRKVIDE